MAVFDKLKSGVQSLKEKTKGHHKWKMFIYAAIILFIMGYIWLFHTNTGWLARTSFEKTFKQDPNRIVRIYAGSELIDTYVGQKIKFTGYVYRMYDFNSEQFVLARNMIVSSDFQSVVVGFLCHSEVASNFEDGCWVEVEGTITKGDYYGEMPIVEVEKINEVQTPTDEYVYPPDDSFVTTSTVLQ